MNVIGTYYNGNYNFRYILFYILIGFMFYNLYKKKKKNNYTAISNNTKWKYNNIKNKR